MFDKLVESTSTGADLGPRRKIFVASFFFVAVLFATAVIASIYAADFDLGNDNFDIAQLLTPIAETEPPVEPEPVREQNQTTATSPNNEIIRRVIMAPTDDPSRVPDATSAEVNPYASTRPDKYTRVIVGNRDSNPVYEGGPEGTGSSSSRSVLPSSGEETEATTKEPPPPAPKVDKRPRSIGVVNGQAKYLPKPPYPMMAKSVGAAGAVNVQVTIDEEGNVISAKAVSGHIMLRRVAEDAARQAKFTPTTLSTVPVKVTGVIVYNFTR